jgi:hypothetical protein
VSFVSVCQRIVTRTRDGPLSICQPSNPNLAGTTCPSAEGVERQQDGFHRLFSASWVCCWVFLSRSYSLVQILSVLLACSAPYISFTSVFLATSEMGYFTQNHLRHLTRSHSCCDLVWRATKHFSCATYRYHQVLHTSCRPGDFATLTPTASSRDSLPHVRRTSKISTPQVRFRF